MCGYCTEMAALQDLLEVRRGGQIGPRDPLLCPIHLQEASNWRAELSSWNNIDHPGGANVALCRYWSDRLYGKNVAQLGEVALASPAMISHQRWLATLNYPPEWQWVLCMESSLPAPFPIGLARAKLDAYIAGCIWASPGDPTAWDYKTLNENFLSVSVAFDLVALGAADDTRLHVLATCSPSHTPFFDGLDLWIQRRALNACVAHRGAQFIETHFGQLRIEAIVSVVLGDILSPGDLRDLQASLKDRSDDSLNLKLDDLLEALEVKASGMERVGG